MILGAQLDGIERNLDPGDPNHGNMYELSDEDLDQREVKVLPRTLLVAVDAFKSDPLATAVMGADLSSSFFEIKSKEWWAYHNHVSDWEIGEYLTKF